MLKKHYSSAKHISIDYTPFPRGGSVSDLTNIQESGISVVKDIPGRLEVLADTSSISVSHVISILNSRLEIMDILADKGSRMAVSDVGVGVQFIRTALLGAVMNVYINTKSMKNREKAEEMNEKAERLIREGTEAADRIYQKVLGQLR